MIRKVPKHITLILNETDTIFLLDLPSCIVPRDTPEGEASQVDNQLYDYLTTGKGRNRKVSSIGVQTIPVLLKTRHTQPIHYEFSDNSTFASNWEMYDTYKQKELEETQDEYAYESDVTLDEEVVENDHQLKDEVSLEQLRKTQQEKELEALTVNENFFNAALVIERLLANNCYNEEQKHFKGILERDSDPVIKYNYKLELLWTFCNDDTRSR